MGFVKKNVDVIFTFVLLVIFGLVPVLRFVRIYLDYVDSNGEDAKMALIELWYYLFHVIEFNQILILFSPLVIIVFSTWKFGVKLYSGFYINEVQRVGYKKFLRNNFYKVWCKSIVPLLVYSIILFLLAIILPTNEYYPYDYITIHEPIQLFIFINFSIVLYSLFTANIGLISIRKNNKLVLSSILGLLIFIGITMVTYIIGLILSLILGNDLIVNTFYVYNFLALDSVVSYQVTLLVNIVITIMSFVAVFKVYESKEKLVSDFSN